MPSRGTRTPGTSVLPTRTRVPGGTRVCKTRFPGRHTCIPSQDEEKPRLSVFHGRSGTVRTVLCHHRMVGCLCIPSYTSRLGSGAS
eukprot:1269455-Rhodomonas_salina.3